MKTVFGTYLAGFLLILVAVPVAVYVNSRVVTPGVLLSAAVIGLIYGYLVGLVVTILGCMLSSLVKRP
jgi:uncharacterized membrane protein YdjX (TVP38/TMEM64 family)